MPSNYTINGVDLDTLFKARSSIKRADVNILVGGIDISNRYEPTNGSDQITINTDIKTNNTDLRYVFQNYNYVSATAILTATPNLIISGGTSILSWTTTGGGEVLINSDIVAATGTKEVTLTNTTTYTLATGGVNVSQLITVLNASPVWSQLGDTLNGQPSNTNGVTGEGFGYGTSINGAGNIVAVGSSHTYTPIGGTHSGCGRVFKIDPVTGKWNQLGQDLVRPVNLGATYGTPISLNTAGTRVALGTLSWEWVAANGYSTSDARVNGQANVYEYNGSTWTIILLTRNRVHSDEYGWSLALNSAGNTFVVGAPGNKNYSGVNPYVRVYSEQDGVWSRKGSDITSLFNDAFGYSVDINHTGDTIVIGAQLGINPTNNLNTGYVCVYTYQGNEWTLKGPIVYPPASTGFSRFGSNVKINNAGTIIAIGDEYNSLSEAGIARMYKWNSTSWVQMGQGIIGEAIGDYSTGVLYATADALSINEVGNRVAIGSKSNHGIARHAGHVRIFEYNESISLWEKVSSDIDGIQIGGGAGVVDLNDAGNIIAIGAPEAGSYYAHGSSLGEGKARVYSLAAAPLTGVEQILLSRIDNYPKPKSDSPIVVNGNASRDNCVVAYQDASTVSPNTLRVTVNRYNFMTPRYANTPLQQSHIITANLSTSNTVGNVLAINGNGDLLAVSEGNNIILYSWISATSTSGATGNWQKTSSITSIQCQEMYLNAEGTVLLVNMKTGIQRYTSNNNVWTLTNTVNLPTGTIITGACMNIKGDIFAYISNNTNSSNAGEVYVYKITGSSTLIIGSMFRVARSVPYDYRMQGISINSIGNKIIVSSDSNMQVSYLYNLIGNIWTPQDIAPGFYDRSTTSASTYHINTNGNVIWNDSDGVYRLNADDTTWTFLSQVRPSPMTFYTANINYLGNIFVGYEGGAVGDMESGIQIYYVS